MEALAAARAMREVIAAEERIKRALRSKLPPSTKYNITPADLVRVYREDVKNWVGPVQAVRTEGKMIHVGDGIKVCPFNRVQVMPVKTENATEDELISKIFNHSDAQAQIEVERPIDHKRNYTKSEPNNNYEVGSETSPETSSPAETTHEEIRTEDLVSGEIAGQRQFQVNLVSKLNSDTEPHLDRMALTEKTRLAGAVDNGDTCTV